MEVSIPGTLPAPAPAPEVAPLSVMGIGSWPRPRWMLQAIHDRLEGRLDEEEFQATADDAVRLCLDAQVRAGADVLTDGEQRRDSYASFVGGLLDNCQLIPPERPHRHGGPSGGVRARAPRPGRSGGGGAAPGGLRQPRAQQAPHRPRV